MSYSDIFNAVSDATFQGRCQVAMWKAAQDIAAEGPGENHVARLDWALRVLQDRANLSARQLAMQVLRNPTIASDPAGASDGDIQYQVNTVVTDLMAVG